MLPVVIKVEGAYSGTLSLKQKELISKLLKDIIPAIGKFNRLDI